MREAAGLTVACCCGQARSSVLCLLFAALCHALGIFAAQSFLAEQGLGSFGFSPWGMLVGEPDSLRQLYQAPGPGLEQDAWLGWGCVLLLAAGLRLPPTVPHIPHLLSAGGSHRLPGDHCRFALGTDRHAAD